MKKKILATLATTVATMVLAGCATTPSAMSHRHMTEDGSHQAFQITMHTGVPGTPQQTVMLVYNKSGATPVAVIEGQTKTIDEKLWDDLIQLVSTAGPAVITGHYILRAAEANCPTGALCGTLVQVQNVAGASAGSEAKVTN
jgi:starvation-inducible outer membrane lipoprotein